MSDKAGKEETNYYAYDPSLGAAVIFVLLFLAASGYHTWQIYRLKSWYFIPFLVGCLLEVGGYAGRAISSTQDTNYWTLLPFILQSLLLLLGPPFYAVSIYMVLGRLIRLLNAENYSLIRLKWLTKFFLVGDIISIVAQGAGGGMLSNADTKEALDRGQTIILLGLGVQIPTARSCKITAPWKTLLTVLYGTSFLIMLRSIFRVAEYAGGKEGELMTKEIYIYIFDALPMIITSVAFNVFHPSNIIQSEQGMSIPLRDSVSDLSTYAMNNRC
ncbi:RTA1 like protein-domain-containing protein [Ilyonectria sp. MPI-CAGE-AT-0026]|nr:RTA1 like protein-domain-containing protein [Ilyonectria sp. MPI-CAGE-AT-0026]